MLKLVADVSPPHTMQVSLRDRLRVGSTRAALRWAKRVAMLDWLYTERAGLQARCCSFVAHERTQTMHAPRPQESRDIFLASDWLSGSAHKETRRENSAGSILEIPHASPHRSQHWRHFVASQPAWQPAWFPASDPARNRASCAPGLTFVCRQLYMLYRFLATPQPRVYFFSLSFSISLACAYVWITRDLLISDIT